MYPLYWFNMPALGKAYIDSVFQMGFAFKYAQDTSAELKGKTFIPVITTGGPKIGFANLERIDAFNIETARFTGMIWKGSFILFGDDQAEKLEQFKALLK